MTIIAEAPTDTLVIDDGGEPTRRRRKVPDWILTVLLLVAVLSLLEVATRREWVSDLLFQPPSSVWKSLWHGLIAGDTYRPHLWATVRSSIIGFGIAIAVALTCAALLSLSRRVENVLYPFVVSFQATPKLAIAPLIIVALGFGTKAKLFIVVIDCFFPIFVNSLQGLRVRDQDQFDFLRSMGASKRQLLWHLRIPAALPHVFAGLNIGAIYALLGSVIAEFVGAQEGLGHVLILAKANFDVAGMYAQIFLLMCIGVSFHVVVRFVERRVTFWARDLSAVSAP